jgi:hypothetical protein
MSWAKRIPAARMVGRIRMAVSDFLFGIFCNP